MACGAVLYFDDETDAAIRGMWQVIEDAGLPSAMLSSSYPPHMSLLLCEDTDLDALRGSLPAFIASHPPVPVSFHSLAVFNSPEGVIYLAPTVTQDLLALHAGLWRIIQPHTSNADSLYTPGVWVPHVTLDLEVPNGQVGAVIQALQRARAQPLGGVIKSLVIADFPTPETEFEELFKARLGSYL